MISMKKKTHEEFVEEVRKIYGDEYTVLGVYNGNKEKVLIRHNNESCGYFEKPVSPNHFLRGRKCRKCADQDKHDKMRKSHDGFVEEVYKLVGEEYSVIGTYRNGLSNIKMKHNYCGYQWSPRACEFVNSGKRCPKCFGNNKKTTDEFKSEVFEIVGNEYSVIGEYTSIHEKIKMKHNSSFCDYFEWDVEANSFLNNGRRCPACSESKGARKVRKYLESIDIEFKREYTFDDLRGIDGGLLRFDFAVIRENQLSLLIEYDGEFHFRQVYKEHDLKKQQLHDSMKNRYCNDSGIELLRIDYTQIDNIEIILEKVIGKGELV